MLYLGGNFFNYILYGLIPLDKIVIHTKVVDSDWLMLQVSRSQNPSHTFAYFRLDLIFIENIVKTDKQVDSVFICV